MASSSSSFSWNGAKSYRVGGGVTEDGGDEDDGERRPLQPQPPKPSGPFVDRLFFAGGFDYHRDNYLAASSAGSTARGSPSASRPGDGGEKRPSSLPSRKRGRDDEEEGEGDGDGDGDDEHDEDDEGEDASRGGGGGVHPERFLRPDGGSHLSARFAPREEGLGLGGVAGGCGGFLHREDHDGDGGGQDLRASATSASSASFASASRAVRRDEEQDDADVDADADDEASKREERLVRNRQKARDRRNRKKSMIEEMQRNVVVLSRMNNELRKKNQGLLERLTELGGTPTGLTTLVPSVTSMTHVGDAAGIHGRELQPLPTVGGLPVLSAAAPTAVPPQILQLGTAVTAGDLAARTAATAAPASFGLGSGPGVLTIPGVSQIPHLSTMAAATFASAPGSTAIPGGPMQLPAASPAMSAASTTTAAPGSAVATTAGTNVFLLGDMDEKRKRLLMLGQGLPTALLPHVSANAQGMPSGVSLDPSPGMASTMTTTMTNQGPTAFAGLARGTGNAAASAVPNDASAAATLQFINAQQQAAAANLPMQIGLAAGQAAPPLLVAAGGTAAPAPLGPAAIAQAAPPGTRVVVVHHHHHPGTAPPPVGKAAAGGGGIVVAGGAGAPGTADRGGVSSLAIGGAIPVPTVGGVREGSNQGAAANPPSSTTTGVATGTTDLSVLLGRRQAPG